MEVSSTLRATLGWAANGGKEGSENVSNSRGRVLHRGRNQGMEIPAVSSWRPPPVDPERSSIFSLPRGTGPTERVWSDGKCYLVVVL